MPDLLLEFGAAGQRRLLRWRVLRHRVVSLRRPARTRKNKKQRIGPQRDDRLAATRPDEVWALDFQVDVSTDGRQIRFCHVVDEFTRDALSTTAARSFTADDTTILLDKIIAGPPNGPGHLNTSAGFRPC
ncbi:MAG TPA: hypothetical protein VE673_18585 [Pseudonocardiaceae bacterium]|nr:hypothetical protein [Pseudonocardiaceae bacterium]